MSAPALDRPSVEPSPAAKPERLLSLDVFRGLTVALMLLVNDPGTWSDIYWPLRHAKWHGWTPTDLVFPFFLFMVGITTHLSLTQRRARGDDDGALARQILRRALILFGLGLFIAWFPGYALAGHGTLADRAAAQVLSWRIPGVLQRIALCYAAAGLLSLRVGPKGQGALIMLLLLGYWVVMTCVPVPGTGATGLAALAHPGATVAAAVDRALFDWGAWGNHLWAAAKTWDPEGALSTLPAVATALLGVQAGRWLARPLPLPARIRGLIVAGVVGVLLGEVWDLVFPINKSLWTSSFVALTAGMACLCLGALLWVVEVRGWRRWTRPALVFGVNPILAYVGSELMAIIIGGVITLPWDHRIAPLQDVIYEAVFYPLLPEKAASLAFALLFVALWWAILEALYRRRIFLKV
ncbi:putative acyltransferase [Nitrospirillum bahiense]|uniref:Putative acyltransferase n=1 Tax=Nitrospirillum amazonense TaxID=28077 RepID=A0A560FUI2_9PROT|nr:putative acyltransferase [Nitrospirillum amazonense]